jgi:hypothetical protein
LELGPGYFLIIMLDRDDILGAWACGGPTTVVDKPVVGLCHAEFILLEIAAKKELGGKLTGPKRVNDIVNRH